jgi:macrolide-specific efflux system membrane fusion protein
MKRWLRNSLIVVALGGVGAFAVTAVRGTPKADAAGEAFKVTRDTVKLSVQEVGSVEPMRRIEIRSRVAGQVNEVLVDVGDVVKANATLVRLDARDARRELQLAEARSRVTKARLTQAEEQLVFKEKARQQGVMAEMELSAARGLSRELSASTDVDDAELAALRDRVAYTQLTSPIDGVVLARNVQPGEMVTPGTAALATEKPLLVVAQVDELLVRTELNQIDVTRLKVDDRVEVKVDALGDRTFVGKVYRIAAMAQKSERRADSNLQVFPVDVVVRRDQPGAAALRPGMLADLYIEVGAHQNVLAVPLEALVRERGKTRLRKLGADGKETLVDVVVGFQNEHLAEIVSGIGEGDSIRVLPADASETTAQ